MTTTDSAPAGTDRKRHAPSRTRRLKPGTIIATALVIVWIILSVLPVATIVFGSVKTAKQITTDPLGWPSPFSWDNFRRGWEGVAVGESMSVYFVNTILFSATAVIVSVGAGTMAAYVLARASEGRASKFFERYFHVLYALPFLAYIIPLYSLTGVLDIRSNPAAIGVVYSAGWLPLALILMFAFFSSIPMDVIEAGKVDGASEWRIFLTIVLPMSKGAVLSNVLLAFIYAWNNLAYTLPLLVAPNSRTVAPGLLLFSQQYSVDIGAQLAGMLISVLPLIAAYLLLHKSIMESFRVGSFR